MNIFFCRENFFLFLFIFIFDCLFGCSKGPLDRPLSIQIPHEPLSLDPTLVEDGVGLQVVNVMHQGLLGYDQKGKLRLRIAEKIVQSKDLKSYVFFIRKKAFWSDGRKIRPEDFVTALKRLLGPQSRSKTATWFFMIQGASSYHHGQSKKLGISAEGEKLYIQLEYPVSYFKHLLTLPATFPLREEVLQANQGKWPENGPVSGGFQLVEHSFNQKMILLKNPYFEGGEKGLNLFHFKVIVDDNTALNLFDTGYLDILTHIPAYELSRLEKQGFRFQSPFFATYYLSFNCLHGLFKDRRWRKAIAGSIRKKDLNILLQGGGIPASSWIPMGIQGYFPFEEESSFFRDAVEWAKQQAKKQEPILAGFDSNFRNSRILEKVRYDLENNMGIKIELIHFDLRTYLEKIKSHSLPLFRFGWMAAFSDPIAHLSLFRSGDPNNYSGWSSSFYDFLLDEIEKLPPGLVRNARIKRAQRLLLFDEAVVVPLFHFIQNYAVSSRIEGFNVNPFGMIMMQNLRLKTHLKVAE